MPQASLTTGSWDLNRGLVNARAESDLNSGELTVAQGVYYKRGSEELWMKAGRAVYDTSGVAPALGSPAAGIFSAEFSNTLATNQVIVRAGTSLYSGDAARTGTMAPVVTGLSEAPLGLWGSYSNQRYYLQDGASPMQVVDFRTDDPTDFPTGEYLYRTAGMNPPTDPPTVSAATPSASTTVLTAATVATDGPYPFVHPNLWDDGDATTSSNVAVPAGAYIDGATYVRNWGRIAARSFTGTGSGTLTNWIISVTYSSSLTGGAKGNVIVFYSLDDGAKFTVAETTQAPQTKHTVTIPLFGVSQDSSKIRVRIKVNNLGSAGYIKVSAFDVRIYAADSAASGNTLLDGVIYWVTEYADRFGIESIAGPRSDSTGAVTNVAGFSVSLPQTLQNPDITTHFVVYRTDDGGAFPTGTLVARVPIRTDPDDPTLFTPVPSLFDPGPLNLAASTQTYGFFQVAGLFFERDLTPPIGTVLVTYQNSLVTAPLDTPNTLRYSAAGFPESWPSLNTIAMGSDRDDTIMGLGTLSSQLGVFMRGRIKRIDHLPTPSDPTFAIAPEDLSPDHGLESRNGLAYITPPGGTSTHIAYVAKDGVRLTNLYQSIIITNNIDWRGTVDTTALSTTILRAAASESRLEFFFTPTATFRTTNGWPPGTGAVMWIHYQTQEQFDLARVRITVHPVNAAAAAPILIHGQDTMFLLGNGNGNVVSGVYVDEVGTTDAMGTMQDGLATVPRQIQTGAIYADGDGSKLVRQRVTRATLDRAAGEDAITFSLTGERIDRGLRWTRDISYVNVFGGAKPVTFNVSGQVIQFTVTMNSGTASAVQAMSNLRGIGWVAEVQGEFV